MKFLKPISLCVLSLISSLTLSHSQPIIKVPEKAEKDLKFIYQMIGKYREKHGKFPDGLVTLRKGLGEESGFGMVEWNKLKIDNFDGLNPFYKEREGIVWYILHTQRPDGSPLSPLRESGLVDVFCSTPIYNTYPDGSTGINVFLRSDGRVEAVPSDLMLSVPTSLHKMAFPNQTNVPALLIRTFEENFKAAMPLKPAPEGKDRRLNDNGGPEALVQLSRRLNYPSAYGIDRGELWKTFSPAQPTFTLQEIHEGAEKLGLKTILKEISLDKLYEIGSPALLAYKDNRIVTLITLDDIHAVVFDAGETRIVKWEAIEAAYSGQALLPASAATQKANLKVNYAVRELTLRSDDIELPQQITITNNSPQPISLKLEYPLIGITAAKFSKETIAPNESTTLDLKLKWRPIIKEPTQNVFLSIQTSDPTTPRLQTAFRVSIIK
jgi:hypothetical protein